MYFGRREMVNKTESLLPSKEVKAKLALSEVLAKPAPGAIKVRLKTWKQGDSISAPN